MSSRVEVDLSGWVLLEFETWASDAALGHGSRIGWAEPNPGTCIYGGRKQLLSLVVEGDDLQVDNSGSRIVRYRKVERVYLEIRDSGLGDAETLTLDMALFPFARAERTPTAETADKHTGLGTTYYMTFHPHE